MEYADRPRTMWIDNTPHWYRVSESLKPPLPSSSPQSSVVAAYLASSRATRSPSTAAEAQLLIEDPWRTWEPIIEIVYARPGLAGPLEEPQS
ncbi:hypothetical protein N7532_001989 [Penicillium argentinense]|uniref:Uncharacterized protein n=1 Tax=Penicillium argentinense TaxID=1131581 RepID=A0A9W9G3K1_9EURO|nr:uncharacterized protein N7532_001989 [Penicillium argentinense]KAJ5111454.1 hypothetical protein N7532_001989 [Penicillium argentinense]